MISNTAFRTINRGVSLTSTRLLFMAVFSLLHRRVVDGWQIPSSTTKLPMTATDSTFATTTTATTSTSTLSSSSSSPSSYYYFAYGSNMYPPTMQSFRGIQPLSATAAILPYYQLTFVSGSAATVRPSSSTRPNFNIGGSDDDMMGAIRNIDMVQGVLYELTESDFARVGWTEGVPWGYTWNYCHDVIPFVGNGESAGREALAKYLSSLQKPDGQVAMTTNGDDNDQDGIENDDIDDNNNNSILSIPAYTLVSTSFSLLGPESVPFSPPSASYVQLLQRGASYWKLDRDYQIFLSQVTTKRGASRGIENCLVTWAERLNPPSSSLL